MTTFRKQWEAEALSNLRALDSGTRHEILGRIRRAVQANEVIRRAGNLPAVRPVVQHRVIGAYGLLPRDYLAVIQGAGQEDA